MLPWLEPQRVQCLMNGMHNVAVCYAVWGWGWGGKWSISDKHEMMLKRFSFSFFEELKDIVQVMSSRQKFPPQLTSKG